MNDNGATKTAHIVGFYALNAHINNHVRKTVAQKEIVSETTETLT